MPDAHPHSMQTRTRPPATTATPMKPELKESDPRTWTFPVEPDFLRRLPQEVTSRIPTEDLEDKGLIAACAALAKVDNRALCATEVGKVAGEMNWMKVNGGTPPNHVMSTILRSHIKRSLISKTTPLLKAYNLMSSCSNWETMAMGITSESKPCQKRMLVWFLNSDFWGIQDPFERCWQEVREKVRRESGAQATKIWEEKEKQRKRSGYRVEWKERADGRVGFDDDTTTPNHAYSFSSSGSKRIVEKRETRSRAAIPTPATPSTSAPSTSATELDSSPSSSMREGIDGLGEALGRGKRKRKPPGFVRADLEPAFPTSAPTFSSDLQSESKQPLKIRLRVPGNSGLNRLSTLDDRAMDMEFGPEEAIKRRKLSADECLSISREEADGYGFSEVRRATLARLEMWDGELKLSALSEDEFLWETTDLGFRPDDIVPPIAMNIQSDFPHSDLIVGLFSKQVPRSQDTEAQIKSLDFDEEDDGELSERDDLAELDLAGEDFDVDDLDWGEEEKAKIKIKKEEEESSSIDSDMVKPEEDNPMLSSRVFGEDEEGNSWNKLERLDALLPAADGDVPSKMVDDPVFLSFFGLSLKDIEHRELSRVGIFETRYDAEEDEDEYEDSPSPVTGLSAYAGRMTLGTPLDDDVAIKIEEEDVSGAPSEYESFDSLSPISNVLSPGTGFTTEEEDEMIAPVDDLEELDDQVWNLDPECSVGSAELMGDKDEPMKEKIGGEGDVSFPTTQTYVPICREPFTPCMKEQELARFEPLEATDQEGVELDAIIDTETTTEAPLTF